MSRHTVTQSPVKTFSLAEVAGMVLPTEWTDGPRWLARRIARKEICGYRVGHTLRMTEQQVADLIDRYTEGAAPAAAKPEQQEAPAHAAGLAPAPLRVVDGLSARSRRRLNRGA